MNATMMEASKVSLSGVSRTPESPENERSVTAIASVAADMLRNWLERPATGAAVFAEGRGAWDAPFAPAQEQPLRPRGSWLDAVAGSSSASQDVAREAIVALNSDDNGVYGLFRDVIIKDA